MSTNLDTNYSRIIKVNNTISDSITDGIATIGDNTVSNLYDPVYSNDAATKNYVDNFVDPGGVSLPLNSIQINTGTTFIGVDSLTFTSSSGLNIYNKFSNGTITITDNVVSGVSDPIDQTGAVTYNYLNKNNISLVTFSTTNNSNSLTTGQVINKYLVREITSSSTIIQDLLPTAATVISFLGSGTIDYNSFDFYYYFKGPATSVLLFGNVIPMGNFNNLNNPVQVLTVPSGTLVHLVGTVIDSDIVYYVRNSQNIYSEPRITDIGITTNYFNSNHNDSTLASFIIYPVIKTIIDSNTAHTYTYTNVMNKLILRSGLTSNTTDTFQALSGFTTNSAWSLGTGQIKFVIQNLSNFDLSIGDNSSVPTGWSWNTNFTRTIPSGHNGLFYINYNGSVLYLYCIGIMARDG
jgi:hypothetical protein